MANTIKRISCLLLALVMCVGIIPATAFAAETINGNTWYGDQVAVDVTAGTDGYTFMSLFRPYVHGYEFSGHFMGEGEGPQTFVMIDTVEHNGTTWTPSGIYDPMESNYDVTYCCDVENIIVDATYYKRMNLEDSGYYSAEQAAKIRSIVTNSYPYVSLEDMKADLKANGYPHADALTRNEIIAAVQTAIWACANAEGEPMRYAKSYKVSDNLQWGYPMYDTSAESGLDVSGKRVFETYEDVGTRIDSLVDYLLAQEATYAEKAQVVITKLEMTGEPVLVDANTAKVTLNLELNNSGSGYEDDIDITIKTTSGVAITFPVELGTEKYTIEVMAGRNDKITATVSGTQVLPEGVYFYAPKAADVNGDGEATSREVSQNLVGAAMGATPVFATAEIDLSIENIPEPPVEEEEIPETPVDPEIGEKTSEEIGENRFEIAINVPGQDGYTIHDEVILMVDGSYSGDSEWPAMKAAINAIGETVLNGSGSTQLTLMAFGMGDNTVLVQVKDAKELAAALGELPGNLLRGVSSTNCEAGFTGVDEYINAHKDELKDAIVIYITDGGINTDETPRSFYYWRAYAKNANNVVGYALDGANVDDLQEAIDTVLGGGSVEAATIEQKYAMVDFLWAKVFAHSGMDINKVYPISEMERAFLQYDEDHDSMMSYSFLIAMKSGAFDKYPNVWNRTYNAVFDLAANSKVESLYLVRYQNDGRATWMPEAAKASDSDNIHYVKAESITSLLGDLTGTLGELSITPFNDVVVTDYMSKWVNLDPNTLKIVDNSTGAAIWTAVDGWLINENRPTAQEVPVIVELVDPADYAAGGEDVIGNTSGNIYKLTWYVKDGAMLRADTYSLVYEVDVDVAEEGFINDKNYPANGNTDLYYTDENGNEHKDEIKVPNVHGKKPVPPTVSFESGDASNISFMLIDANGNVEFLYKKDIGGETSFEIPVEEGKISAVFVKQGTSGMFWFAQEVDEETQQAVIDCLKANNPAYKGHNAIAFGAGDHDLEFKKNKFVTYTFSGNFGEFVEVEKVESEEPAPEVEEEPVVEETPAPETEDNSKNNKNKDKNNNGNKNKNKNK